jgi:acyl-CoA reductase-like NAD-dependent aldehyde dehydrogenase
MVGPRPGIDVDEEWKLLIGGEWVATSDHYAIVDPNTTEVVGRAPEATVAHATDAAAAARAAQPTWKATPPGERCRLIGEAARALAGVSSSWVDLVQAETGATINVAETMQVAGAFIDRFKYYSRPLDIDVSVAPVAAQATALAPAALLSAHVVHQPVGVVACITPYNFPLTNVAGKIAPALAMGNTVIIKPAPQDPLGTLRMGEVLNEIFPPGVVNVLVGSGPEVGAALVASRDVNMISFTGSSGVGARIFEAGGATMKRLLMELGGKGALIMTGDCDIGAAVRAIASVWGFHSGQICTAPTRVICHRSIYDQTVESLKATSALLKVGDARQRDTLVGPVITELHRDRVEGFIRSGVDAGATLVVGGERPDLPGYFVAPTLLADCTPDMHVVREEAFGPVVVMLPADDDDHAVALANDSDYGLFSYVFAGDNARAMSIARRLESGNVGLNTVAPHMEAPFGGFKMSGVGRDRGPWGLHAYSEIQAISY